MTQFKLCAHRKMLTPFKRHLGVYSKKTITRCFFSIRFENLSITYDTFFFRALPFLFRIVYRFFFRDKHRC